MSQGMKVRFYPYACTTTLVCYGPGLAGKLVIIQFSMSSLSVSIPLSLFRSVSSDSI